MSTLTKWMIIRNMADGSRCGPISPMNPKWPPPHAYGFPGIGERSGSIGKVWRGTRAEADALAAQLDAECARHTVEPFHDDWVLFAYDYYNGEYDEICRGEFREVYLNSCEQALESQVIPLIHEAQHIPSYITRALANQAEKTLRTAPCLK